jgi:hypothetical protein
MTIIRKYQRPNPVSDGLTSFNPNQMALLILHNSQRRAEDKNIETYSRFKMREVKITDIMGQLLSSDDRWSLINAMNDLGWQVAVDKNYWTFIKTSITERWPNLNSLGTLELSTEIRGSKSEKGIASENFEGTNLQEVALFYYGKEETADIIKNSDDYDLSDEYEENLDFEGNDLSEFIDSDEFSIWELLYFSLIESGLINDVFNLEVDDNQ